MLTLRSLRAAFGEFTEHMRVGTAQTHLPLAPFATQATLGTAPLSPGDTSNAEEVDGLDRLDGSDDAPDTLGASGAHEAPATTLPPLRAIHPASTDAAARTATARRTRPLPYRDIIQRAAGFWLATRIAYAFFTYFAVMFQNANAAHEFVSIPPYQLLDSWKHWDALWYIHIAQQGYWTPQAAAFFPLYPFLIKVTSFFTFGHWMLAAMIASNLGALLAFIGVALLAAQETRSRAVAMRSIYLLAAFPLAFFLVAPYTEGFFIAFVALSFFCARRGTWFGAAGWAFCAALVRPTGALLLPALLWELGRQQGWWAALWLRARVTWAGRASGQAWAVFTARVRYDGAQLGTWWRETPYRDLAWWRSGAWRGDARVRTALGLVAVMAAVPCAILVFMTVLELRFGHPLLWLHVQRIYWRRDGAPIWNAVSGAINQVFTLPPWSYYQARDLVDLAPVLAFGILTIFAARRMPFMFTIYMIGLIYVAVSTPVTDSPDPDLLISAGRFMLTAVPMFLVLGQWTRRRPNLMAGLLSGGFLLQAVLAAFFLAWGWII